MSLSTHELFSSSSLSFQKKIEPHYTTDPSSECAWICKCSPATQCLLLVALDAIGLHDSRLVMRVLNSQAPDVEVITDGNNDIHDKASVDTKSSAEHQENKGSLVHIVAKRARPAKAIVAQQDRANRIGNAKANQHAQDVPVGEAHLGEVCGNHLPDAVSVDEASEQGKGDQVVVEDVWLQIEVGNDQGPDGEEGNKAKKGAS